MKAINVGCGMDYRPGWMNTDISYDAKADLIHDIRRDEFPLDKDEVDLVYASGVLEQILENEHLLFAFNEVWRVLKPGGLFEIVVPNAEHSIAFQDPMDVRKFVPKTFDYLVKDKREYQEYGKVYGFRPWSRVQVKENQRHILVVTLTK